MEILYQEGNDFKAVVFDATVSVVHESAATATEHAVEKGVAVVDHIRPERDRISAEVHVSNTPVISLGVDGANGSVTGLPLDVGPFKSLRDGVQPGKAATWDENNISVGANVLQFPTEFDRIKTVFDLLQRLMRDGTELTVTTRLRQYDSMVLTHVSAPVEAKDGTGQTMGLELVEIRYADSQTVAAPVPLQTRGKKKDNRGSKPTTEPTKDNTSLARKLVDGFLKPST